MLNNKFNTVETKKDIFELLPKLDLYENYLEKDVNYLENLYPEIYYDIGKYFEDTYINDKKINFTNIKINNINNEIFNQMTYNKKLDKLSQDLLHDIIRIVIVNKLNKIS